MLEGSRILTRTVSEEEEKDNKRTSGDIVFHMKGRSRRCFQYGHHLACPSRHLVGQVSAGEARVPERALEQELAVRSPQEATGMAKYVKVNDPEKDRWWK